MSNNDELIAQFTEITGRPADTARFYLESSNWALEDALSTYLTNQADGDDGRATPEEEDVAVASSNSTGNGRSTTQQASKNLNANKKFDGPKTARPKIATLHNMSQRSSSDEEGQAFYAGGSERSGQQVLGPPKRKNFSEKLTDMFRQAQELGQEMPVPSTSNNSNWGVGLRLGQTESDHSVVNSESKRTSNDAEAVILKLWSQGFSINDGELRMYDDPDNKDFLETVMRGEIPPELMEMGSMVSVDVEDHRHEDFKKIVKKTQTFKGAGHTLGSPAPNVLETTVEANTSPKGNEDNEKLAVERLQVDPGAELTQLQIRLADGSRITSQFNLTHTVADIRQFIQHARPQYANRSFALVSTYPAREIDDDTITIEKAGLKNAAIMQRLK